MTIKKDGHFDEADWTHPDMHKEFGLRREGRSLVSDDADAVVIHALDDNELAQCEANEAKAKEKS